MGIRFDGYCITNQDEYIETNCGLHLKDCTLLAPYDGTLYWYADAAEDDSFIPLHNSDEKPVALSTSQGMATIEHRYISKDGESQDRLAFRMLDISNGKVLREQQVEGKSVEMIGYSDTAEELYIWTDAPGSYDDCTMTTINLADGGTQTWGATRGYDDDSLPYVDSTWRGKGPVVSYHFDFGQHVHSVLVTDLSRRETT